jgi:HSP20 family protein
VTLMRFDPFRELDRLGEPTLSVGARALHSMPMEAMRRGDELIVDLDVPGVGPDDIDLTVEDLAVERNVVSIRVRRLPARQEGDEVLIDGRPHGAFVRQLLVGDDLDADRLTADARAGVLTLTIPGQRGGQAALGRPRFRPPPFRRPEPPRLVRARTQRPPRWPQPRPRAGSRLIKE